MNIDNTSLKRIDQHWSLKAIGKEKIQKVTDIAHKLLVEKAIGNIINFNYSFSQSDYDLMGRVALAYEMAAFEGLKECLDPLSNNDTLRQQCASGAYRAFEIRRVFRLPDEDQQKIFQILHLSALACCGDRWTDLRRWYKENDQEITISLLNNDIWDIRLLNNLYNCWVKLFRKNGWDDLNEINKIIIKLREDQEEYEPTVLKCSSNIENRAMAFRLISFYHWAKASEILAQYILQGNPSDILTSFNLHFQSAIDAVKENGDFQLEILLRWLQVSGNQMVWDVLIEV